MYLEQFTKEQQKKFYEELSITEESLERDVNYLIEWLEKQPHLPKVKGKLIQCIFHITSIVITIGTIIVRRYQPTPHMENI